MAMDDREDPHVSIVGPFRQKHLAATWVRQNKRLFESLSYETEIFQPESPQIAMAKLKEEIEDMGMDE